MEDFKISDSTLSNRSKNQLIKNGYIYTSQLENLTDEDLGRIRNLGAKSIQEIQSFRDNMIYDYKVHINIPIDMTIESLRSVNIEEMIDDKDILNVLKINNIKLMGIFLDLSYEDIKKLRNINDGLINEIQSICSQVKEKMNLIDRDLFKLVYKNPHQDIRDIILENIPKTFSKVTIKYFSKSRYVDEINIEDQGFSNKEQKLILTHSLNKIDNLLSTSYKEWLMKSYISKKTLNAVLEKLLNQVVVRNKYEYFIGDISRLYLKESSYSYLLVMRENILNNIQMDLNDTISKVLNGKQFSINHEIDLLLENQLMDDCIKNLEFNEQTAQEIVYAYVKNSTRLYSKNEMFNKLSNHFLNLDIYKYFDELIELDLISIDELDKVYSKKPSILFYTAENYNETTLEMIKLRLEGKTLEEIGNATGVSRERVRQVVKKVINSTNQIFKEDENAYWFSNYDLDNKQYKRLFNDNLYYYLSVRYEKGLNSWEEILNDDKASTELKKSIRNEQLEGKIEIGNKLISISKTSIIDYVLEEFGEDILHVNELSEIINLFLEDLGLDIEGFNIDIRYIEERLSDISNAVSRGKKYYRYYNYNEYDWDLFYEKINFEEWKNVEISTLILFKYHPSLMKSYNIKHENELHNIIRRTKENRNNLNIKLNRMPTISIGNVNREQQVKDLMFEYAPLYVDEFVHLYYEKFGIKEQTVKANYLDYIDKYIVDDYIKGNFSPINEEKLKYIESILDDNDFMFIEDLKENLDYNIVDLSIILKHLNYKTFTSYALKSEYDTTFDYFNKHFYNNMDIVDFTDIDKRIWNLSSFNSWIYDKYKTMELLEFSPKMFITRKKLNEIGLTSDVLEDFRMKVLEKSNDKKVWSINNIIETIDNEQIDSFGFEPIFYRSILRGLDNIYSNKIGGNYLLKRDEDFTVRDLIEEEVTKVKMIDIFDLTEFINEKYDVNFEYYKLTEVIKRTNMYYDEIMEKVYLDLNYYYEEFEY
ncbi:DNA-directed RNA polymerase subunit alpha C-terminal domain-containing protein [Staphylococcus pasteuri]|uniref:DNA-directed RNA polymerase subunit alpha C-terminal domain-containing protein n=1 Tax=Staphylococcus pasteuri TaxID=45972 RepID=UPI000F837B2D|nr:DNA-directed RNA polymerase subunit alpha C-terminal domain-containing protein [Staphylococcus pasteuri]QQN54030.1 hypothetical protein I6I26_11900 [Staphylococcus pasteuri]RTX76028.1 hypothetical protein CD121_01210 [Staphylococcus pasteuri]